MNELLATLGSLVASLGNVQSAGVLRERIALMDTKLGLIKEHVEKLEKENAALVHRCRQLEQQAARQKVTEELVSAKGALFKRNAGGGYEETPICPKCHNSMWCFESMFPYECSKCRHIADFKGHDLSAVIAALPR